MQTKNKWKLTFYFLAPIIKGDQNISGVQILQTIHQLVEDNTKMGDELKDRNEKIESLRTQINDIHKKNERYAAAKDKSLGGNLGQTNRINKMD